jgi:hypothetical protein
MHFASLGSLEPVFGLQETNQEVPGWLQNISARAAPYGQKPRRGGGGGGGNRFGGRDFRQDRAPQGGYGGGGGGYGGGGGGGYGGGYGGAAAGYGGGAYGGCTPSCFLNPVVRSIRASTMSRCNVPFCRWDVPLYSPL